MAQVISNCCFCAMSLRTVSYAFSLRSGTQLPVTLQVLPAPDPLVF